MAIDQPGSELQPDKDKMPVSAGYLMEHGVSLWEYVNILYRHRTVAITTFLLVLIVGILQTYTAVPQYRATAQILIRDERSTAVTVFDVNDPTFWVDPELYYQTQYRILASHGLAQRVVTGRTELASAREFSGDGPQSPTVMGAVRSVRSWIGSAIASLFTESQPDEVPLPDATAQESALANYFVSRVGVSPVRNTRLVNVSFETSNPGLAARAVNALVDEYMEQNLELTLDAVQGTLEWLTTEIARQQAIVEQSERALAYYRESRDALSLEDRQNLVVSRLNQLNEAVTRANTNLIEKETLYRQVQERVKPILS